MTPLDHSRHILDSMLGYLGFTVQIEEEDSPEGPTLQILTEDTEPSSAVAGRSWMTCNIW
jgi:spoIIIJ-associated protein